MMEMARRDALFNPPAPFPGVRPAGVIQAFPPGMALPPMAEAPPSPMPPPAPAGDERAALKARIAKLRPWSRRRRELEAELRALTTAELRREYELRRAGEAS
jgi:hypothetical protein